QSGTDPDVHAVTDAGAVEVGAGDLGVLRLVFEGDHPAGLPDRPGEPDGRVPAEGADLQDTAGTPDPCEQVQELALWCGDVDGREFRCGVRLERRGQRRIVADQYVGEVVVGRTPVVG